MASFTNNSTINTTITLSDISESAYNKILDFIRSVVDRENGVKPEKKTALKPEQKPAVQKEDPAPEETVFVPSPKYAKVSHYREWEKVVSVCMRADENPGAYTEEWITAAEWMELYSDFDGASLHGVSHTLGSMANLHIIRRKSDLKEGNVKAQTIWFYLPIPKDEADKPTKEPEQIKVEDPVTEDKPVEIPFEAIALKQSRKAHGYSAKEFADVIGYPIDVVLDWECGKKKMSADAKSIVKVVLGPNALAEAAS